MTVDLQLTHSVRRNAGLAPDGAATVEGDVVRTHAQLADRVARGAAALQRLGLRPGDRVSALAMNSSAFFEHYLSAWWIGAIPAPLNIRWTDAEMIDAVRLVGPRVLFADRVFADRAVAIAEACPSVERVVRFDDAATSWESMVADSDPIPDGCFGGDHTAILLYTGGTTGRPKAVELTHRNVVIAGVGQRALGCGTSERLLHAAPMFHMGFVQMASGHLLGGGTHVFIPGFDAERVAASIERYRVTDILLAPTMIEMLLRLPAVESRDLTSLTQVVYGTSPITPALLERAMQVIPDAEFVQGYGMSETAMTVMLGRAHHRPESRASGRLASIGTASPFAEIRIVDGEGSPVAAGEPGELLVRGPSVMKGYWGDPEQTALAIDHQGWLHTGDGARLDDEGFIFLTDRIKDMIVTGSENVFSLEVENAIGSHPDVAMVAVVGVPHPVWIEAVHAVVVPVAGASVTAEDVIAHARARLAGFKVPRSVEFVDALPLSAAAKVLKNVVRREAADRLAAQAV